MWLLPKSADNRSCVSEKPKIVYGPEDVLIGGRAALVPEGKCMDDARINPVSRVHEDRWRREPIHG